MVSKVSIDPLSSPEWEGAVDTISALKAIPAGDREDRDKRHVVATQAVYAYDLANVDPADEDNLIAPDDNVGRWVKVTSVGLGSDGHLAAMSTTTFSPTGTATQKIDFSTVDLVTDSAIIEPVVSTDVMRIKRKSRVLLTGRIQIEVAAAASQITANFDIFDETNSVVVPGSEVFDFGITAEEAGTGSFRSSSFLIVAVVSADPSDEFSMRVDPFSATPAMTIRATFQATEIGHTAVTESPPAQELEIEVVNPGPISAPASFIVPSGHSGQTYITAVDRGVQGGFVVPPTYVAGQQIFLGLRYWTASTTGVPFVSVVSNLVQDGQDMGGAIPSDTNSQTIPSSGTIDFALSSDRTLPITNASGEISATAVQPGDSIGFFFQRLGTSGSDTNPDDLNVFAYLVQF